MCHTDPFAGHAALPMQSIGHVRAPGRDRGIGRVQRHLGESASCPGPSREHERCDRQEPATGFA
jgi:hypothetical protein